MKVLMLTVLSICVFTSAILVVINQHQARRLFIDVQSLENERDMLNEEWGKLQLEQSTWATNDRIETISRDELKMMDPESENIVYLLQ